MTWLSVSCTKEFPDEIRKILATPLTRIFIEEKDDSELPFIAKSVVSGMFLSGDDATKVLFQKAFKQISESNNTLAIQNVVDDMILKGNQPLTKEDLEKYIQYFISKNWPQWKRERSLRKGDGEFNSFMEDNNELIDFHSRRLVEMAGNIIMGYLLVINSQKSETFSKSAKLFVNLVRSENFESYSFIEGFEISELELYKVLQPEEILEEA